MRKIDHLNIQEFSLSTFTSICDAVYSLIDSVISHLEIWKIDHRTREMIQFITFRRISAAVCSLIRAGVSGSFYSIILQINAIDYETEIPELTMLRCISCAWRKKIYCENIRLGYNYSEKFWRQNRRLLAWSCFFSTICKSSLLFKVPRSFYTTLIFNVSNSIPIQNYFKNDLIFFFLINLNRYSPIRESPWKPDAKIKPRQVWTRTHRYWRRKREKTRQSKFAKKNRI